MPAGPSLDLQNIVCPLLPGGDFPHPGRIEYAFIYWCIQEQQQPKCKAWKSIAELSCKGKRHIDRHLICVCTYKVVITARKTEQSTRSERIHIHKEMRKKHIIVLSRLHPVFIFNEGEFYIRSGYPGSVCANIVKETF